MRANAGEEKGEDLIESLAMKLLNSDWRIKVCEL
jgi:hypothetical protein